MTSPTSLLLLVGSPKKGTSTSEVLGTHVLDRLAGGRAIQSRMIRVHRALSTTQAWGELAAEIRTSDLVILATPLYADSLPSHVVAALERICAERRSEAIQRGRLACIVNCGFPESKHCDTAIRICREFAKEAGFEWAGGLALGGGEAIGGKALSKAGGMVRNVRRALDLAADALAVGDVISDEAVRLMARPLIPSKRIFTLFANFSWRMRARKFGAQRQLDAQPYGGDRPLIGVRP